MGYPTINQRIEAEAYTNQVGVQFQTTTDLGGGENAGWLDTNDYLEYVVNIPTTGNYQLQARVAAQSASGQLQVLANNQSKVTMDLPITNGWQTWQTTTSSSFSPNAGLNTIRLRVTRPGFNLNYFQLMPSS